MQFPIGNIFERSFEDIWYGAEAGKVRAAILREPGICASCDYGRYCVLAAESRRDCDARYFRDASIRQDFAAPKRVDGLNAHSIVRWGDRYYGVPHRLGTFDVRLDESDHVPGGPESRQAARPHPAVRRVLRSTGRAPHDRGRRL